MEVAPSGGSGIAATEASDQTLMSKAVSNIAKGVGTVADQATVMDGSAKNLVGAAGGGFKLEPAAAAQLAASCRESLDELEKVQDHLGAVSQAPKLGSLPGVSQIADFTQSVGADSQGIVHAVNSLKATLQQMEQAYMKASTNYQETNEQVADTMKRLGYPDLSSGSSAPAGGSSSASSGPNFPT